MFSQIHEIIFYGKGGYDYDTVYNMPVWLRRYTFQKLNEFYEKQNEETEKVNNVSSNKGEVVKGPNIAPKPTYTTKARN